MLKRAIFGLAFAASLVLPAAAVQAAAPPCHFILGFAAMSTAVSQVGSCVDDQAFAANGDAVQHTSGGLLVWRKADNWTAFTDGYHTWVNGPQGIQQRLNSDRFPWEARTPPAASDASSTSSAAPLPSSASYTAPTTASLGLTGAATAAVDVPLGDPPTPSDLALVQVPAGAPALASLPEPVQLACVHLVEDLSRSESKGTSALRRGDLLCPYANVPGWSASN